MSVLEFQYGEDRIKVTIPDELLIEKIRPETVPPISDIPGVTQAALFSPYGTPPLDRLLGIGSRVLIAVPDKSRHTDLSQVVQAVLDRVTRAGVKRENITIIIATGTHRLMTPDEIAHKYSSEIFKGYRVVNHVYDDASALTDIGTTKDGLPVQFNRFILEHDFTISIGNISPHPVGGFSGGAKGLLPGIAGKRSTDYFHWEATNYPLFDIFGNAENPVRREMEQIVDRAGLDFIVNTTENADRRISGIFAGHFITAHRAGVDFLKKTPLIAFPTRLPDILVVGLGKDRPDLWGGAAGIYLAAALLQKGGTLVLFAACPEGVARSHPVVLEYGYKQWRAVQQLVNTGEITDKTGASHIVTVGKILEEKQMHVIMVSRGIAMDDVRRLGFESATEPQEAVDRALRAFGDKPGVLIYERI